MDETLPSLSAVLTNQHGELEPEEFVEKAMPVLLENAYAEVFVSKELPSEPFTDVVTF